MASGVELVAFLTVLREVETGGFLGGGDAQPHGLIDQEEQHERAHDGQPPSDADADGLVEHLVPVAVDGAGGIGNARGVFAEDGVDGSRRQAGR